MKLENEVTLKSFIGQLERGFKTLSRSNLISSYGVHMSVAAGLVGIIAGFVLALKDSKLGVLSSLEWRPSQENGYSELRLVPGLKNLGNNCFLNVILQALASCSCFKPFLQKVLEEYGFSEDEVQVDGFPLAIALSDLLEDLCVTGGGRVVLSPWKVMIAVEHYIQNFDLTSQQDAAEAFLHLLSSLREELSDCYIPNKCSLVEVFASNCRIITPKQVENQSELARWQQHYLGPFDGILGSILTCRSCSSQISLNFESFHSLPLPPVLNGGFTIMPGCTLENCLKQFTVAEQVENYHCSHCWHTAAVKYLSAGGVNQEEIKKIKRCTEQDSCDCRRLSHLDKLPWSNKISYTLKQISIARCPKVLCIHLKRVSINMFGELVKLQGHISFPLVLDLSQFMTSGMGVKSWEENMERGKFQRHSHHPSTFSDQLTMMYDQRKLNHVNGLKKGSICLEGSSDEYPLRANVQDLPGESSSPQSADFSRAMHANMYMHPREQLTKSCELVPVDTCLYHLAAVVEHFGRAGSGHYTVYRGVRADLSAEESGHQLETTDACWFAISDTAVCSVSKEDVLAAEASLLFYEKYEG